MAPILRNLIQTSYFRVVVVEDVDSVECCGALKVMTIFDSVNLILFNFIYIKSNFKMTFYFFILI